MELFTIGHGNLDFEVFLAALQCQGIGRVIDVRSIPHSRYAPWAGLRRIESALQMVSIVYEFAGRALGGRPANPELRTQSGTPDYERIAQSTAYLEGIEHVLRAAETERIALLCSEANPMLCHRERLIGRTLRSRGCTVRHILPDGTLFPITQGNASVKIYTLGYTQKPLRRAISLLRDAGVDVVVDVRLRNSNQLAGWAKRDDLEFILETFGIGYLHQTEVAPSADLLDAYRRDHNWDRYAEGYNALITSRGVLAPFETILERYKRPCLLCSEHSADRCHRRLLADLVGAHAPDLSVTHLV